MWKGNIPVNKQINRRLYVLKQIARDHNPDLCVTVKIKEWDADCDKLVRNMPQRDAAGLDDDQINVHGPGRKFRERQRGSCW